MPSCALCAAANQRLALLLSQRIALASVAAITKYVSSHLAVSKKSIIQGNMVSRSVTELSAGKPAEGATIRKGPAFASVLTGCSTGLDGSGLDHRVWRGPISRV